MSNRELPPTDVQADVLAMFGSDFNNFTELAAKVDGMASEGMGRQVLNAMFELWGGHKIHVPEGHAFYNLLARTARDEEIRAKFRGRNIAELAQDYELTTRQVRNIIASDARRYKRPQEAKRPAKLTANHHEKMEALAMEYTVPLCEVVEVLLDMALEQENLKEHLREKFPQVTLHQLAS